jgi:hypothetical protein
MLYKLKFLVFLKEHDIKCQSTVDDTHMYKRGGGMLSARSGSEGILLPFNFFKNTPILSPGCLEACQLIVCCLYSLCNITNGRLNFRVAMKRNAQSIKYLPILLSPSSLFTIMAVIFSIENC